MQRLDQQVMLVTGAATGIGRATAQRLAAEGASVFAVDINGDELANTVASISEAGGEVSHVVADISVEAEVVAAVTQCVDHFGRLDGLANIAGIQMWGNSHETDIDSFRRTLEINLVAGFVFCREALPHLRASKGAIVNMASVASNVGIPYSVSYCASKGGVLAMTRSLAVEYGKEGVRVNAVCPGGIDTQMTSGAMEQFPDGADMNLLMRAMSLDGFGTPDDIASVVAMLLSPDGAHINGAAITVDGGATA